MALDQGVCDMPRGTRLPCQVCGRAVVPLKDGTARYHSPGRRGSGGRCQGSGFRVARWPVGQRLQHYMGSVWEVIEDRSASSRWGDYLMRCVVGSKSLWNDTWIEAPDQERTFHGEYMHRDGWRPVNV